MNTAFTPLPADLAPLAPGLYLDLPAHRYHEDPCATPSLSSGDIRKLDTKPPAHVPLENTRLGGKRSEPTKEMIQGAYVHALLGGGLDEFAVLEYDNYASKAAQGARDAAKEKGFTPILRNAVDHCERIAKAVREKAAAGLSVDLFGPSTHSEVTAIWEESGVLCRARFDKLVIDEGYFVDVWDWKVTGDISHEAIMRTIIDKGYHIQADHYLSGLTSVRPQYRGMCNYILGFVENDEPFGVQRVTLSEGFLSVAAERRRRAMRTWKECLSSGVWPDNAGDTLCLTPPAWYLHKTEEAAA